MEFPERSDGFVRGGRFSGGRHDVQILVDVHEFVGLGAIRVVPPLARTSFLTEDGAVGAQERVQVADLAAVVPHLFHSPKYILFVIFELNV